MAEGERVGTERIGNGEREVAIAALRVHHGDGRLDSREYEDRSVRVRQARTWDEVEPLFSDLPEPGPESVVIVPPSASAPVPSAPAPASVPDRSTGTGRWRGLVPEPWADRVMALTPLVAMALFFTTGIWLWWLAIPIVGLLIYGPDGRYRDH